MQNIGNCVKYEIITNHKIKLGSCQYLVGRAHRYTGCSLHGSMQKRRDPVMKVQYAANYPSGVH